MSRVQYISSLRSMIKLTYLAIVVKVMEVRGHHPLDIFSRAVKTRGDNESIFKNHSLEKVSSNFLTLSTTDIPRLKQSYPTVSTFEQEVKREAKQIKRS
ncbi:hypothetical protein J6590_042964 [Homalodisca vitripennis]|nr:hypothetical protein J6590_042964 [Homalodisca vitripennis]